MKPELIGMVFGRLTVVAEAGTRFQPSGQRKRLVECSCSCGTKKVIKASDLKTGNTQSCGCLLIENAGKLSLKHGEAGGGRHTSVYKTWCKMRERCLKPSDPAYANYGGRGITVCDRWLGEKGFQNFRDDMGPKPTGCSIERIRNKENYCPENCKWGTRLEQANNTRANVFLEFRGERKTVAQWTHQFGYTKELIRARLKTGWSVEEAIITPPRPISKS